MNLDSKNHAIKITSFITLIIVLIAFILFSLGRLPVKYFWTIIAVAFVYIYIFLPNVKKERKGK